MVLLVVMFLLALIVPIAVAIAAHRRAASIAGGPRRWADALASRTGALALPLALAGGLIVSVGAAIAAGLLAKATQPSIDEPVYRWVYPRVHDQAFTRLIGKLTLIGNNPTVQLVVLVSVLVLAPAYRRRWWLPTVAIVGAYYVERYAQKLVASVVHRGHPPTDLGTYPSGGVARILAVYGVIVLLILPLLPRLSRAWRCGLWTGVTTAATVEAFTRVYLSKHWMTDTIGGLLLGGLLLLTAVVAASLVTGRPAPEHRRVSGFSDPGDGRPPAVRAAMRAGGGGAHRPAR